MILVRRRKLWFPGVSHRRARSAKFAPGPDERRRGVGLKGEPVEREHALERGDEICADGGVGAQAVDVVVGQPWRGGAEGARLL